MLCTLIAEIVAHVKGGKKNKVIILSIYQLQDILNRYKRNNNFVVVKYQKKKKKNLGM